jgi:hypothetical protein
MAMERLLSGCVVAEIAVRADGSALSGDCLLAPMADR